jgi:hypothetical protein
MKKYFPSAFLVTLLFPFVLFSQEKDTLASTPAPKMVQKVREPNRITAGIYIKLGPVFPTGAFATKQILMDVSEKPNPAIYLPAKMGAAIDMGYLIYIGPAFAYNHLRLGIDATFISFSFNPVKTSTTDSSSTTNWYYFVGQKFGPLLSVCPVDRLIIDFSYKMNAYAAYVKHQIRGKENDEWGMNLTQNEISMNIRYSIILFSFQYNFGKVAYNDFDAAKPTHYVDNSTYRIMIGFKF